LITERFRERRKAIYNDLDRKKGPTHKQVTDVCLAELSAIVRRIVSTTAATWPSDQDKVKQSLGPLQLVPRISEPLKEGQITGPATLPETRLQRVEVLTGQIARTHSSPQNARNSQAKALLKKGQDKASQGVSEAVSVWENYKDALARSPVGWFICPSLRRAANATVLGEPYSRQAIISNAITALTNLSVSSLKEDDHGRYQNEIPDILRIFTRAIKAIEQYKESLQVHWADVETLALPEAERKKIPEVDQVTSALRDGLGRILGAFNEYLASLGMTPTEIQEAKLLVAPEGVIRAG
jgi:nucleoporin NDC1